MTLRFLLFLCTITALLAALLPAPPLVHAAAAQAQSSAPEASATATPRTADGHPDLNGVWGTGGGPGPTNAVQQGNTLIVLFPLEGADPFEGKDLFGALDRRGVARKAAAPNKPPYKPELQAQLKEMSDLQSRRDPAFYCKPEGVPRMGAPDQIVQTPEQVVFLYENRNTFRVIPTNGRPHSDDVDQSWMGDSVGRWEGDTLVVDVTSFTDESWLGADGWFHSDAMHVVERFRREGDALHYSVIVEDPVVLSEPWEPTPRTLRLQSDRSAALIESPPCVEMSAPNMVTDDHH